MCAFTHLYFHDASNIIRFHRCISYYYSLVICLYVTFLVFNIFADHAEKIPGKS